MVEAFDMRAIERWADDPHDASNASVAQCLPVLLELLGWAGSMNQVVDALPHFSAHFALDDLRNALATLGFASQPERIRAIDIHPDRFPCLLQYEQDGRERLAVLVGRTGARLRIVENGRLGSLHPDAATRVETAYFFRPLDNPSESGAKRLENWVVAALGRFRMTYYMVGASSFLISLMALATPLFVVATYNRVVGQRSLSSLGVLVAFAAIALAADFALRSYRTRLIARLVGRLDYLLGVAIFDKLLSLPTAKLTGARPTSHISRLKSYEGLRDFLGGPVFQAVLDLPTVVLLLIGLAVLGGPIIVWPLLAMVALAVFGAAWLPRSERLQARAQALSSERQGLVFETCVSLSTIRDLGMTDTWRERMRAVSASAADAQAVAQRRGVVTEAVAQAITSASALLILASGALRVLGGAMSVGSLIGCVIFASRLTGPIQTLFLSSGRIVQCFKAIKQINQLMALEDGLSVNAGETDVSGLAGRVTLDRVSLRYPGAAEPALLGVSLDVPEGSLTALIGAGASGASPVLEVIAGVYRPQVGQVLLGGAEYRQLNVAALKSRVMLVPRDTQVFFGTIAQNLRLAAPLADQDEIDDVSRRVGLYDAVMELPDGWETRLGDKLTGQFPRAFVRRLCLARALLSDADILLFDEPERDLDDKASQAMMTLLQDLRGEKTIMIASHRPSFVRLADKAVLMDRGRVLYEGEPDQALAQQRALLAAG